MTEAETKNLKMYAEWFSARGDHTIRSALVEIDRLKAAHRETVNLIAWLDPSRTRTAQYRQMAQDAGIPEDAS